MAASARKLLVGIGLRCQPGAVSPQEGILSLQSQALTQVLPTVQNATREFYLEVGLTHEGFQCFQKAWSNLMEFSPGDIKDNQDVVRQKGWQLGRGPVCVRAGLGGSLAALMGAPCTASCRGHGGDP